MRRLFAMLIACVATTFGAAVLAGLLTVWAYWGYWIEPPAADRTAAAVVSVDRYSDYSWDGTAESGPAALGESARWEDNGLGESPWGRLPAALRRRGLQPAAADPVPPATLDAVKYLLDREGHPVGQVRAHVAEGRGADGQPVVLAAVFGPELSNDHYPYYEVAAAVEPDGRLRPVRVVHYYFDVAGLEGSAPFLTAVPTAGLMVCLWGVLFLAHLAWGDTRGPTEKRDRTETFYGRRADGIP